MSKNTIKGDNVFTLKIAKGLDEIGVTSLEWNQLVFQSETNTIFQTYEWFQSWWKIFGAHHQLYLVTVYKNQELLGIAPLMISGRYPSRTMLFIGDGKSDYCDFIIKTEKKKRFFPSLLSIFFATLINGNLSF